MSYSKGAALFLSLFPPTGIIGVDKLYLGLNTQFWIQLLLASIGIGLVAAIPWNFLTILSMLSLIFFSRSFMFGDIDWKPTTNWDRLLAGFVVLFWIIIIYLLFAGSKQTDKDIKNKEKEKEKDN